MPDADQNQKKVTIMVPEERYLFPTVIHHVVEGWKTIHNQEDLDAHMKDGWTREPQKLKRADELRKKINYHVDQAATLTVELEQLEGGEPEPQKAQSGNIQPEAKRGPGRPKASKE